MEQRVAVAKRARDFAKRRVGELEGKLEDSDSKKAQAISVVSARDKKLVELKELLKQIEQQFYNMGFNDARAQAALLSSALLFS